MIQCPIRLKIFGGTSIFAFCIINRHRSLFFIHDDVIKWKHVPRYWPFVRGIHRSPVNSPHKGQWRGALMFFLICARINDWVNNGGAGDLKRHRAHCDVIVMGRQWPFHPIQSKTWPLMSGGTRKQVIGRYISLGIFRSQHQNSKGTFLQILCYHTIMYYKFTIKVQVTCCQYSLQCSSL